MLRLDSVFQLCNRGKAKSFVGIAHLSTTSQCTDARDRVFALLSLVKIPPKIEPNYKSTVEEVYRDLFFEVLRSDKNLKLLRYSTIYAKFLDLFPS